MPISFGASSIAYITAMISTCRPSDISGQVGISGFVNTLGATLAPVFGIMIVDYYLHRGQILDVDDLYDMSGGRYHYSNGWNLTAVKVFAIAAIFSVATVWVPWFGFLSGYNWVIGACLGGALYYALAKTSATT